VLQHYLSESVCNQGAFAKINCFRAKQLTRASLQLTPEIKLLIELCSPR
jgi:hypothetical protein